MSNWNRMKKQELKQMRRGFRISGTTLSAPTSESGLPEEEEEQEIENLFEQIIKENFPSLTKEIDVQEAQRESQRNWIQGGTHQSTS